MNFSNIMYIGRLILYTVIDFLQEYSFTQVVNFPTRASNTLDVFITNRPSLIHHCDPIAGISDHEAVFVESSITISQNQCTRRKFYLWHTANISSINETITQFTSSFLNKFPTSTPVDILWEEFKVMCYNCLDLVPTKLQSNRSKQPWVNSYIKQLSCKKQ